jgi:hypothetical protein
LATHKIFLTIRGGAGFAEPARAARLAALPRPDYSGAQIPGRVEIVTLLSPQFNAAAEAAKREDIIGRKS